MEKCVYKMQFRSKFNELSIDMLLLDKCNDCCSSIVYCVCLVYLVNCFCITIGAAVIGNSCCGFPANECISMMAK